MKKTLSILTLLIISVNLYSQKGKLLKPDRYDTSYENGYVFTLDTSGGKYHTVRELVKMIIYVEKQVPCSKLFIWMGGDTCSKGMYWYENVKYDSTKNYGPCGFSGMAMAFYSDYKGDTIIEYNCESGVYSLFKEVYYIPNKKIKKRSWEQYDLNTNEYFAEVETWKDKYKRENSSLVIGCY